MSVAQDRQNAACIGQLSVYLFEKKREEKDDKQATVSSEMKENSCSADRQKKAWVSWTKKVSFLIFPHWQGFFIKKRDLTIKGN